MRAHRLAGIRYARAGRIAPEMRVDIAPDWVVEQFRARYPKASPIDLAQAESV